MMLERPARGRPFLTRSEINWGAEVQEQAPADVVLIDHIATFTVTGDLLFTNLRCYASPLPKR
jgi:hypothetical protein